MSNATRLAPIILAIAFLGALAPHPCAADAPAEARAADAGAVKDAPSGGASETPSGDPPADGRPAAGGSAEPGQGDASAAAAPPTLDITDADAVNAAVGKTVTVEAEVASAAWSKSGKVLLVELKGAEQSRFMLAAFVKFRAALDEAFGGDVAKALAPGRRVRVSGEVKLYKRRPEILLDKADQLQILDAPAGTAAPATGGAGDGR